MKIFSSEYKKHIPWIFTVFLFVAMGLTVWLGILPLQNRIKEKADSIQEYYAFRENRERQINKLPEFQTQFEEIRSHEKTLEVLLSESEIITLVQRLERLAEETDVQISIESQGDGTIQEKKPVKATPKKATDATDDDEKGAKKKEQTILEMLPYDRYLRVSIIVIGEYDATVQFLHRLETLPFALDVIGFDMRLREKGEEKDRPDNPGRNPFLILSQGEVSSEGDGTSGSEAAAAEGPLKTTFDTVIYVSK